MKEKWQSYVENYVDFLMIRQRMEPLVDKRGLLKQTIFGTILMIVVFGAIAFLFGIEENFVYVVFATNTVVFGSFLLYRMGIDTRIQKISKEEYKPSHVLFEDGIRLAAFLITANVLVLYILLDDFFPWEINLILAIMALALTIYSRSVSENAFIWKRAILLGERWFWSLIFVIVVLFSVVLNSGITLPYLSYPLAWLIAVLLYLLKPYLSIKLPNQNESFGALATLLVIFALCISFIRIVSNSSRPTEEREATLFSWDPNYTSVISLDQQYMAGIYEWDGKLCVTTRDTIYILNEEKQVESTVPAPEGTWGYLADSGNLYVIVSDPTLAIDTTSSQEMYYLVTIYQLEMDGSMEKVVSGSRVLVNLNSFHSFWLPKSMFVRYGKVVSAFVYDANSVILLQMENMSEWVEGEEYSFYTEELSPSQDSELIILYESNEMFLSTISGRFYLYTNTQLENYSQLYHNGWFAKQEWTEPYDLVISKLVDNTFQEDHRFTGLGDEVLKYANIDGTEVLVFGDYTNIYIDGNSPQTLNVMSGQVSINKDFISVFDSDTMTLSFVDLENPTTYRMTGSLYAFPPVFSILMMVALVISNESFLRFHREVKKV